MIFLILLQEAFATLLQLQLAVGFVGGTPTNIVNAHTIGTAAAVGPYPKMLQASALAWENIGTSDH